MQGEKCFRYIVRFHITLDLFLVEILIPICKDDVFAQALLQTVSKIINEYYTGDIKESWEDFVQFLTMTMQEGAEYDALNRATGMHL